MRDELDAGARRYYEGLPRRYLGAGVLLTDPEGRVLVVEPTYKPQWEIPGGTVEAGEDPRTACQREAREEIGLDVMVGALLVMEHQTFPAPRGDSIMFVFDGGVVPDPAAIVLQAGELASFRFVAPGELGTILTPRMARRMTVALEARASGRLIELVNGEAIGQFVIQNLSEKAGLE